MPSRKPSIEHAYRSRMVKIKPIRLENVPISKNLPRLKKNGLLDKPGNAAVQGTFLTERKRPARRQLFAKS